MESIGSVVIKRIRSDFAMISSVGVALANLSFLARLFDPMTRSEYIYSASLASFATLVLLAVHQWRSKASERKAAAVRLRKLLVLCYLVLAMLALVPGFYRLILKKTNWLDPKDRVPVIIGHTFLSPVPAYAQQSAPTRAGLRVEGELDPDRTSLRCGRRRGNGGGEASEIFLVSECAGFGLYGDRARHLALGHQLASPDRRQQYETETYPAARMRSVGKALEVIQTYRKTMHPLLEDSANAVFLFTKDAAGKDRLLRNELLPKEDEWKQLQEKRPELAHDLRWFVTDWVGIYAPVFKMRMINESNGPITVATIRYNARHLRTLKAEFIGLYDRPRYQLKLQEGEHEENIQGGITIKANTVAETDWVISLKEPKPGAVYSIAIEFVSSDRQFSASLPEFTVAFFEGKGQ